MSPGFKGFPATANRSYIWFATDKPPDPIGMSDMQAPQPELALTASDYHYFEFIGSRSGASEPGARCPSSGIRDSTRNEHGGW